ncbi:class I SAM-dependent methyltransferase [Candidatus Woesearchaeota archaeon]|nr:class I SAM-dependent methyltransferase [Candidatus Woesearchaeota archaeon]
MSISKIEKYYNKKAVKQKDWREKSPIFKFLDKLKWYSISNVFTKTGKVLDAGGGEGRWSIKLAKHGHNISLVDISQGLLSIAEKNIKEKNLTKKINIFRADIRKLPFPSNYFDYILCEGDVLCITPQIQNTLKELRRVLKKNGIIYATFVSYYHALFFQLKKGINDFEKFQKTKIINVGSLNFHTYKKDDLERLFTLSKFHIAKISGEIYFTSFLYGENQFKELKNEKISKKLLHLEKDMSKQDEIASFAGHLIVVAKR